MLDGNEYEVIKMKYEEYSSLCREEPLHYRERDFNDVLEMLGMMLNHHENEVKAMEGWYEAQELWREND